ncbi:MAG: site-specific DNA-methyltransferase [Thermoflexibacter sp.]|jgi:site-specific DNA-methyltransferase (adenine-specific)|nr:site-specific DNA-methyltransferase [Thermoflexibacter sp.]
MNNQLFYGDNLEVLRKYIADESVDLCYIDPPFNSDENYNQTYSTKGKKDTAQAQAFIDTWTWNLRAADDYKSIVANENGVFTAESVALVVGLNKVLGEESLFAYIVSMTQRIAEIYRVLKPTGSFYLHCDPTASHYLKLICDTLFIPRGGDFKNEIIWHYGQRLMHNKYKFNQKHDTILFYVKSKKVALKNQITEVWTKEDISKVRGRKIQVEEDGREFIWDNRAISKGIPAKKQYIDEIIEKGKAIDDVWDIPFITSTSKERLGYPTQKPEALLERIIKASSNEGDVILDTYCGCGTTIAVAERLKRKWIGIDITYQSISLILKRLEDSFGGDFTKEVIDKETQKVIKPKRLELSGVPKDFASAVALANKKDDRVRKEFEKWAVLSFSNNRAIINDKKGGDGGIDGTAYMVDFDENNKQVFKEVLFSVKTSKTLSPSVIRDLNGTLEREKAELGYLITLYPMPNLVKEATKYGTYQNKMFGRTYPKIEVINIQEMLDGKQMSIPTAEVLKSAERKNGDNSLTMF